MNDTKHDIIDKLSYELDEMSKILRNLKKEWHSKGDYRYILRLHAYFMRVQELIYCLDDLCED